MRDNTVKKIDGMCIAAGLILSVVFFSANSDVSTSDKLNPNPNTEVGGAKAENSSAGSQMTSPRSNLK